MVGPFVRSQTGVVDWYFVDVDPLQSTDKIVRFRRGKLNRDRVTCRGTFKEVKTGCGTRPQERDLAQSVRSQAGVIEWCFVDIDTLQSTDEIVGDFVRSQTEVIELWLVDSDTLRMTGSSALTKSTGLMN
jgi:hypothetical protein